MELLLQYGAGIEAQDSAGRTTPALAVAFGNLNMPVVAIPDKPRIVELLLKIRPSLLGRRDNCEQTCIAAAISYGNCEKVRLLLDYPGSDIRQGVISIPLLCYAAYSGKDAVVKLLIEQGVSLQGTDGRYGRNALSWATCSNKEAAFTRLLNTPGIDGIMLVKWAGMHCSMLQLEGVSACSNN
ncbi:ankyrin repeat-containing domain protein [Aspergillus transmontanensis]|uniref:Ankyrin repeat-containing domain protein n=1 Tax=Aspergillus transmontanensis TaxID=1034304 RepID=A0A5N6W9N4_9EURO|nr:ankyrin repeat-containing domain protein [Aspergillus transmontanensis]